MEIWLSHKKTSQRAISRHLSGFFKTKQFTFMKVNIHNILLLMFVSHTSFIYIRNIQANQHNLTLQTYLG